MEKKTHTQQKQPKTKKQKSTLQEQTEFPFLGFLHCDMGCAIPLF